MGEYDGIDVDLDFSGDGECHTPDSHLERRFPRSAFAAEVEPDKAA